MKVAKLDQKKRKQIHGIEDFNDGEVNQLESKKGEKNTMDFFFKKKSSGSETSSN